MDLINSLPDHIFVKIFGNLSPKMIKTCNLVCQRWDEMIANSIQLMSKFQLNFNESESETKFARRLKRKYQSATIKGLSNSLNSISHHNLQYLKIDTYNEVKLSTLRKAVNRFPSLKVLIIELSDLVDDISSSDFKKIEINLKELDCPAEIIYIFDCKSIKVLKMSWCNPVDENKKIFISQFLKQQDNIKDLMLYEEHLNEFFAISGLLDLNFALKSFKLKPETDFWNFEMLINFLDRHKFSLTSLELPIWSDDVNGIKLINNYVLENLIKLKHIELGQVKIRNREAQFPVDILQATKATKNIDSIAVSLPNDENDYKRFFALFPNLKHLRLDNGGILKVSLITAINANLETLSFGSYEGDSNQPNGFAYFPNLKELSVHDLTDSKISDFINRHSKTLEKLTFRDCDNLTYETINAIFKCTNLKYLEVCIESVAVPLISMVKILNVCSRSLTLKICYSLDYDVPDKTFIFPDDKALWDDQICSLKLKIDEECCAVQ